jgi:ATP-binding cassette subfamily B protein
MAARVSFGGKVARVTGWDRLVWPRARAPEAIVALAGASALPIVRRDPMGVVDPEPAAAQLGLEAEPVGATYADIDAFLDRAGPALVRLPDQTLVALVRRRRARLLVVGPDRALRLLPLAELRAALCAELEAKHAAPIDALLDAAQVSPRRRRAARQALLRQRLAGYRIELGWMLRPAAGAPLSAHVRWSGLGRRVTVLALAHLAEFALSLLAWWFVGRGALEGRLDAGFLFGWALALFSQIPFRLLTTWLQASTAIEAGALLKRRLLAGSVQLSPDTIRMEGIGQLLGRILESEAIELLAINAGVVGLMALLELAVAAEVLALGAGGTLHVALLATVVGVAILTGWSYHRERRAWTGSRLRLTHDLVESMVGHQTRLAQAHPDRWHDGEDDALDGYLAVARHMDARGVKLVALVPRGWILLGLAGLIPAFAAATASRASLAIAMGGILLAFRALRRLVIGIASLSGAAIAWRTVGPIFHAASAAEVPSGAEPPRAGDAARRTRPIIEASELSFRYPNRGRVVLDRCSLTVHAGDRLLVEGSSGSGKSTLGAILAGLREPQSGLLLVDGWDRKTLGIAGWRRRVTAVPQFHENHVFSSTFAFNLLMGRAWPPKPEDLAAAEALCKELDLGPLLERMPAGLNQVVGETGWQLSHGERGRLFAARALLQGGDVVVLDESFAALDPRTLQRALECALRRSPSLIVIAHP